MQRLPHQQKLPVIYAFLRRDWEFSLSSPCTQTSSIHRRGRLPRISYCVEFKARFICFMPIILPTTLAVMYYYGFAGNAVVGRLLAGTVTMNVPPHGASSPPTELATQTITPCGGCQFCQDFRPLRKISPLPPRAHALGPEAWLLILSDWPLITLCELPPHQLANQTQPIFQRDSFKTEPYLSSPPPCEREAYSVIASFEFRCPRPEGRLPTRHHLFATSRTSPASSSV